MDVGRSIAHVINGFQKKVFSAKPQNNNRRFSLLQLNGHQKIRQLQIYGYQLVVPIREISKYLKIKIMESLIMTIFSYFKIKGSTKNKSKTQNNMKLVYLLSD